MKKNRIIALLGALAIAFGISLTIAPQAQALGTNSVHNTSWSASNILVCGNGSCPTLYPGATAWQGTYWSPDQVAVCPYCTGSYRAVLPNGYTTGWVHQSGGRFGTWINAKAVHEMWGNNGVRVEVAMSNPNY